MTRLPPFLSGCNVHRHPSSCVLMNMRLNRTRVLSAGTPILPPIPNRCSVSIHPIWRRIDVNTQRWRILTFRSSPHVSTVPVRVCCSHTPSTTRRDMNDNCVPRSVWSNEPMMMSSGRRLQSGRWCDEVRPSVYFICSLVNSTTLLVVHANP